MTVVLEGLEDFNLDTLKRVAWDREPVVLGAQALARMRTSRAQFLELLEREPNLKVYGVTTGYDDAAGTLVSPEERARMVTKPPEMLAAGIQVLHQVGPKNSAVVECALDHALPSGAVEERAVPAR